MKYFSPAAAAPTPVAAVEAPSEVEFVSPPPNATPLSDSVPRRTRTVQNLYDTPSVVGLDIDELHLMAAEEPAGFADAEQHQCWLWAMLEEMSSIEENGTWKLVDLTIGHCPIGLKWVYKVKKDSHGAVVKHKSWLVAKGYV